MIDSIALVTLVKLDNFTWVHIQYVFKIMSILDFLKILVKTNISSFDFNQMKHSHCKQMDLTL